MLEAQNLAARRGQARLFSGLSFRVGAGEALVVTGANGTGKTTLLRMLAGPRQLSIRRCAPRSPSPAICPR
jgi:ABC-type transport system involved in cytochrome c biogenesis ATPase subunit